MIDEQEINWLSLAGIVSARVTGVYRMARQNDGLPAEP